MDLKFFDDPSEHLNEIRNNISDVNDLLGGVSGFLADLPTGVADFLDSIGYDSAAYRRVPYFDNPFVHAFWESLSLGVPNSMKRIMFHSKALEAHIRFAKLRVHPNDPTIRTELDELKSQLLELASSLIHRRRKASRPARTAAAVPSRTARTTSSRPPSTAVPPRSYSSRTLSTASRQADRAVQAGLSSVPNGSTVGPFGWGAGVPLVRLDAGSWALCSDADGATTHLTGWGFSDRPLRYYRVEEHLP